MNKTFVVYRCSAAALERWADARAGAERRAPLRLRVEPWKKIPIPPLHDFKPVEPKRIVLENGLTIFLQEDHELPFINGAMLIRGGSRDEPASKTGLVSLYGQTWRTSGTKANSGDALDDMLAQKAASIETGGGQANTSLHWSSFSKDFTQVFALAVDVLLHPEFKAEKLQLAKRGITAGIARRNDDASAIAGREAVQIAYGKDSPYARQVEYATIGAVELSDLNAWHERTLVPNNMIVSVSGDFEPAMMEAALRKAFEPLVQGHWSANSEDGVQGSETGRLLRQQAGCEPVECLYRWAGHGTQQP